MRKVLFTGSRSLSSNDAARRVVIEAVAELTPTDLVIVGDARGPDTWVQFEATRNGNVVGVFRPAWDFYGRSAGIIRNRAMVPLATEVITCWDGTSRGTLDTIRLAEVAGLPIRHLWSSP